MGYYTGGVYGGFDFAEFLSEKAPWIFAALVISVILLIVFFSLYLNCSVQSTGSNFRSKMANKTYASDSGYGLRFTVADQAAVAADSRYKGQMTSRPAAKKREGYCGNYKSDSLAELEKESYQPGKDFDKEIVPLAY